MSDKKKEAGLMPGAADPESPTGTPADDGGRISDADRALLYFSTRQPAALRMLEEDFAYVRRAAVREERARVAASGHSSGAASDEERARDWLDGHVHDPPTPDKVRSLAALLASVRSETR